MKRCNFHTVFTTVWFVIVAGYANAGDRVVDFGSSVPTLEQLRALIGDGSQRVIEMDTQNQLGSISPTSMGNASDQGSLRHQDNGHAAPPKNVAPPAGTVPAQANLTPNPDVGQDSAGVPSEGTRAPSQATLLPEAQPRGFSIMIGFAKNSAEISDEYEPHIDRLAEYLRSNQNVKMKIVGHTDASGSERHNWILSMERAESVRRALVVKGQLSTNQLFAEGRGENESKYADRYDGRNRRVEFLILN